MTQGDFYFYLAVGIGLGVVLWWGWLMSEGMKEKKRNF